MRSYWKLAALAAAIYGLQTQVDSRALPESTSSLAERDVSSASKCKGSAGGNRMLCIAKKLLTCFCIAATLILPYGVSALRDRDAGDLEKRTVLLGRKPVAPPRIGGAKPHGSGHGDDSAPSSEPGDPESAPPRIGDDDGSDSSTKDESHGPARIAGDQSSANPATPASGLAALEGAATNVIQIMKGVPEFSEDQIAVIGGMAIMKYLPGYRTTKVSLVSDLRLPKPSNMTGC